MRKRLRTSPNRPPGVRQGCSASEGLARRVDDRKGESDRRQQKGSRVSPGIGQRRSPKPGLAWLHRDSGSPTTSRSAKSRHDPSWPPSISV